MTNVSDLISSAVASPGELAPPPAPAPVELSVPEQKIQQVAATADAKRVSLGGVPDPQTFRNAAAARVTGSGVESANPIEKDLATLSWSEIEQKYGAKTASGLVSATQEFRGLRSGVRDFHQTAYDVGSGVGLGLGDMVGGLASLGLSGVDALGRKTLGSNTHMGVWAAEKVKDMNEAVQHTQSPLLNNMRDFSQQQTSLDSRDNLDHYEKDVAAGDSKLFAGLKQIGRDALDTAKETATNPTLMSDLAANAGGSILGAGPLGKAIGLVGSKVLPAAAEKAIAASAMPVSVGLQEASGAYQQTAADVAGMSHEDLQKNSPYYRDLIAKGVAPEDARAQAADKAGQMAGAIAAPAGVVAGHYVGKFLEHPFSAKSGAEAVSNILKETVEEGAQGATGQLAQNVGEQNYADEAKRLTEGVGAQIAQGALGGLASAGAMQAPTIAAHGARAAGQAALDAVVARADKVEANNEAQSPSSDANVSNTAAKLSETMDAPKTMEAIANAVHHTPEEQKPAAENLAEKITALSKFDPSELSTQGMSDSLKSDLGDTSNRVDALLKLSNEINSKGADTQEGLSAARELSKQLSHFENLAYGDEKAFDAIPKDHMANHVVDQYQALYAHAAENPTILKALSAVQGLDHEQINNLVKPVTEESLKTPEGQDNVQNAVALATLNPSNANLQANEAILEHAKNGKVQLTEEQHRALMTSVALMKASEDSVQRQKDLGHTTPLNSVSEDVLTKAGGKDEVKRSASDYASRIFNNMRAGNTDAAKGELENFGHFVTHMTNKSDAVNQHYVQGGGEKVSFQARNPVSNQFYASTGNQLQGVTPHSPKSVEYAQRVNLEAKRVADIYNGLSKAFPELGAGEKQVADLHENLQGKPNEVAQAHRKGDLVQPGRESASSLGSREETAVRTTPAKPVVGSNYIMAEGEKPFATKEEARQAVLDAGHALSDYVIEPPTIGEGFLAHKIPTEATPGELSSSASEKNFDTGAKVEEPTFQKFDESTGTLGIPREDMPQVKARDHGALTNFLNAKGIEHETKEIPAGDLKPTQAEFSPEIVDRVREKGVGDRSVIVSQDGHVIDGHHQWLAAKENDEPVKAIELKTSVHEALDAVKEFPSAKVSAEGLATSTKAEPKTTKEAYPALVGTKEGTGSAGQNWFHNAFQIPKDGAQAVSRLLGLSNPAYALYSAFKSEEALAKFMGENKRLASLPSDVSKVFGDYVRLTPTFVEAMNARLQAKLNAKDGAVLKALQEGKAQRWAETRVLNLVEQQEDGSFKYNKALVEQSIMAGLHWLLNTSQFRSDMDADLVHALTGISKDRAENYVDMLDVGLSPVEAVRSLGDRIVDFWGVTPNDKTGIGHTDGIPQAMAAEVLKAFQETLLDGKEGLLKVQKFVVDNDTLRPLADGEKTDKRIAQRLVPNIAPGDKLFSAPSLIEEAVLRHPKDKNFYAGDEVPVAPKQMNNRLVENTTDQKAMISTAQAQPYRLNERMFNLYSAIGEKGLLSLFGGGDLEGRKLNEQHKLTLDGKNTTVQSAWDALQKRVAEMKNLPEGLSTDIHYAFNVSAVGRLQMLGGQTPQLSKLIREAILPTWSNLDLEGNKDHLHFFNLALAQALGVKIHAKNTATINEELHDLVSNKFAQSIELLQEHLASKKGELSSDLVDTLKDEFKAAKETLTPVALHALMEHARWLNASEQERSKFETGLYVEADGVTNGVANAIRMLTADRFNEAQLENMAKTGQFFANSKTMNDHRGKDNVDLYSVASNNLKANLDELYKGNPELQTQMNHAWTLLDLLVPGVAYDGGEGTPVVDRGVTKNPMTMMIYGAGAKSMSVKLADIMARALYEKLSDAAQARFENPKIGFGEALFGDEAKLDRFSKALNGLITAAPDQTKEGLILSGSNQSKLSSMNPETFAFTDGQLKAIQKNLLHLFVNPMRSGIETTMGASLAETSKLIQTSTQVQSVVLEHMFKQRVEELQAQKAKEKDWSVTDGLSQSDLNRILKDLTKEFPLIETGKQTFWPVNTDTSDLKHTTTSGLNGEFKTSPQIYGPSDAGVKGGPMLNIGMGDGAMIQHMLASSRAEGLPVFDGFNFGLDKIVEGSLKANQAASEAWQGNPLRDVLNSFSTFTSKLDMKTLEDPAVSKALAQSLLPPWLRGKANPETLRSLIDEIQDNLTKSADMVDARHAAIAETQHYVDQMAGAQHPFLNKGETVLSGDFEAQAKALNAKMDELAKAPKVEKVEKAEKVEAPTPVDLSHVVADFTPEQSKIWKRILQAGGLDGYRIETGDALGPNAKGLIDIRNKLIRMVSPNAETLVHEAIHASTFDAVLAHYEGGDLGPRAKEVADAVSRLEKLMDQFQKLDINETTKAAPDYVDALRAINDHLKNATPLGKASALNEFMAWTLANKGLTDVLKSTPSLVQMAKDVWAQIKRIVFGTRFFFKPGEDMYSQVLFDSSILVQEQPNVAKLNRDVSLFQNSAYGTNDRLTNVNEMFDRVLSRFLKPGDPVVKASNEAALKAAAVDSAALALMAKAQGNGFSMTQQQKDTFSNVVHALALDTHLDPNALAEVNALYQHVTKNLTRDMLIDKSDPDAQRAESIAQMKFDVLMGHAGTRTDAKGRSSLLPVFLGLSLVDDGLRAVLSKMDLPKSAKNQKGTLDAQLQNLVSTQMENMVGKLAGLGNAKNVSDALDNLTRKVGENALDTRSTMEEIALAPNAMTNRANDAFVAWMERVTDKVIDQARDTKAKTKNDFVKRGADVAEFIAGALTTKNGELQADALQSFTNRLKGFTPLRELISDIIGRTKSNADVYDMIKQSNAMIGQVRQQFREHLPGYIADQFSRTLDNAEWSTLHHAMGKTDLAALADHFGSEEVLNMLADPRARRSAIRTLEGFIQNEDPQHAALVQSKAEQLANYMTSGEYGTNLLRNADAISGLYNEKNVAKNRPAPSETFVKAVDQLTTLYALGKLSPEAQESVSSLVQSEPKGMDFVLNYLKGQRTDEVAKATGMAKLNAFKGYIPSTQQQGVSLVVANDSEAAKLLGKSYVRLGDYNGSNAEGSFSSRGYYYAPVSGRAAFSQGIVQNAAQTSGGVEIGSGRLQGLTGGRITNPVVVDRIAKQLHREGGSVNENLLPVFNDQGKLVAFERGVDPSRLVSLNQDTHLGRMLGVWHGRQVEEAIAGEFNNSLVDKMLDMYNSASNDVQKTEFVDLFNPKSYGNDPVIRDAISLMTPETRGYIKEAFGDQFMVRKDMLNDVIGYRKASVGDAWTGNTRWNQETQDGVRRMAIAAFGNKAYANLVNAEGIWQEGVSIAKTTIVVKSLVVPASNFVSNMLQLTSRGVPLSTLVKGIPRKVAEAEAYSKGRLEKIELEGQLRAAEGAKDFNAQVKLKARIQSIDDGFKRLSIWPLIEAGEFGAISHTDLSRDDLQLYEGKLHEYLSGLADKLPESVKNAGRYALITKDTALFQGLAKAVEYGDFLGKAMQYEHYVTKKGLSSKEALGRITEEYVNFDRLPGRARGYLESMGLAWFMNFKIRSTKVALSMIRENPLQALLGSMMPHHSPVGTLGTPIEDNIVSKAVHGTLGYSLGPGMMFHAPALHPVGHLLGL